MSHTELSKTLGALGLSPAEAAQLLGVSPRTLRRWLDGEEIPGPAQAAVQAWLALQTRKLAWKPDSVTIFEDDQDQIARLRDHSVRTAELLKRVEARGGPRAPWSVNVAEHKAVLGPIEVGFYLLPNGSFSLGTYTRRDKAPDLESDWPLIEDAASCIATTLAGWKDCSSALEAVACHLRTAHKTFVSSGPRLMSREEKARRTAEVDRIGNRISVLATEALVGRASSAEFEALNQEILALGTRADDALVFEVARTFHRVSPNS